MLTARYPLDRDLHLRGRGLRLVPSYFCWDTPVALADDELADRLGISATAVSRHAAVLRDGGLITSTRDGAMVLHSLTRWEPRSSAEPSCFPRVAHEERAGVA
ncbi:ArsR/SmtB family transcription factor [Amycolatopsis sp. lyj-112]|uniref:ArsR/SmtB family transcription factor n=1 Tax=Amycolatopsis sp. lyj-112 TaxID=2789288 RepID=UPI00397A4E4D